MSQEQSLEDKLRAWLGVQGYPLEMQVARAFQQAGARVVQSDYYVDPNTGEPREIDVVASWQDDIDGILARISVVIECKASRDKPWVLFCAPEARLAPPARVAQRAASQLGRIALRKLASNRDVQSLPMFSLPRSPAYGLRQGFADKADVCFAAISGAAAAAAAQAKLPDTQNSLRGPYDILEIIFPCVVTDARLFSAALNEASDVSIVEIESGILLWRNPVVGAPHTILNIVNSASLTEFSESMSSSALKFLSMCRGELRETLLGSQMVRNAQRANSSPA